MIPNFALHRISAKTYYLNLMSIESQFTRDKAYAYARSYVPKLGNESRETSRYLSTNCSFSDINSINAFHKSNLNWLSLLEVLWVQNTRHISLANPL